MNHITENVMFQKCWQLAVNCRVANIEFLMYLHQDQVSMCCQCVEIPVMSLDYFQVVNHLNENLMFEKCRYLAVNCRVASIDFVIYLHHNQLSVNYQCEDIFWDDVRPF